MTKPKQEAQHIPRSPKRKQVSFDETTIAEHDLERGSRMKIVEPPTPFVRTPSISDDEAALASPKSSSALKGSPRGSGPKDPRSRVKLTCDLSDLATALEDSANRDKNDGNRSPRVSEETAAFKEKRRKHYNEIEAVRKTKKGSDSDGE